MGKTEVKPEETAKAQSCVRASRRRWLIGLTVALLGSSPFLGAFIPADAPAKKPSQIKPEIPSVKRTENLVFLEHADELYKNSYDPYMILVGNVHFSKGGMQMYTDSAHYYESTGSFDAFGNVRMEQGDTLFVYADELNYDGLNDLANLYGFDGKLVKLINRDVKLETDIFTYDLAHELGSYYTGGVLTDRNNRLESVEGEYSPATKDADFFTNVILTSVRPDDQIRMVGDALYYNTATHIAEFTTPTVITNKDGRIDSESGVYNTETEFAELFAHSIVTTTRGSTLEGDTLFYDRKLGFGEAFGNMVLNDTIKKSRLSGDYGFYNEITDSAFVTGHALGMEFSQGDTLYVHGRYLKSIARVDSVSRVVGTDTIKIEAPVDSMLAETTGVTPVVEYDFVPRTEMVPDTTHVITAWPRVRFYRYDIQGLCDSLIFTQADSTVRLHHHPVVWSEDRQIYGNVINVLMNDSTVERVDLPDFGFTAQGIVEDFYNQITGKTMTAWFDNGEVSRILVSGSVEGILFPEENDSTINKFVNFQTANLEGWLENQVMKRTKMWPETSGNVTPLYLARKSDMYLPKFVWYGEMRPGSAADIFVIPAMMEELMSDRPIQEIDYRRGHHNLVEDEEEDDESPKQKIPEEKATPEAPVAVQPEQLTETNESEK